MEIISKRPEREREKERAEHFSHNKFTLQIRKSQNSQRQANFLRISYRYSTVL